MYLIVPGSSSSYRDRKGPRGRQLYMAAAEDSLGVQLQPERVSSILNLGSCLRSGER